MKYYISVSGNNGSGKTTIAKLISNKFSFAYIPKQRIEMTFLEKFFKDPQKFFINTQLSFLLSKAIEIENELLNMNNIIVDRSIYEDIEIFAKYWIKKYHIDEKVILLYNAFAEYILNHIPKPDLIIYCKADPIFCKKRIEKRQSRKFENFYPDDFIDELEINYSRWINSINDIPYIIVDTQKFDISKKSVSNRFLKEFEYLITIDSSATQQLSLFQPRITTKENFEYEIIELKNIINFRQLYTLKKRVKASKPKVYIAAPFTDFARKYIKTNDLFDTNEYGALEESYIDFLLEIEFIFKKSGFSTFIPHRDVNNWGKTRLTSSEVVSSIINHISESDLIFAIPSSSIGVHFELGIALSKDKKIIIANVRELKSSFFLKGFSSLNEVIYFENQTLNETLTYLHKIDLNKILHSLREY